MSAHRLRMEMPFGWPTLTAFGITVAAMLLWGALSIFWFAEAVSVEAWEAWIPAVATTGTMLVSSSFAAVRTNSNETRREAMGLGGLAVAGDVVITAVQHYLAVISKDPQNIHPGPYWGGFIGGIPSLMVAILIHLAWQVWKDHSAAKAAALETRIAQERDREARQRQEDGLERAAQREAQIAQARRLAAETELRVNEAKAQVAAHEVDLENSRTATAQAEALRLQEQINLELALTRGMVEPAGSGRPGGQPDTSPQPETARPDVTGSDRAAPDNAPKPAPDVTALLPAGREIAAALAKTNTALTRPALVAALKDRHVPCGTDKAAELLRQLRTEAETAQTSIEGRSDRRRLQILT